MGLFYAFNVSSTAILPAPGCMNTFSPAKSIIVDKNEVKIQLLIKVNEKSTELMFHSFHVPTCTPLTGG